MRNSLFVTGAASTLLVAAVLIADAGDTTTDDAMMAGRNGWRATAVLTVGESVGDYRAPGRLDGLGAYAKDADTVRVLASHELGSDKGTTYSLANGTRLRGARVSFIDIDRRTRHIRDAGVAYQRIYDRRGNLVASGAQINEKISVRDGLERLCSSRLVRAGERGFVDTIYFCGEETSAGGDHPHGGTEWALDVARDDLWACPELGRGKWENVTPIETGSDEHVALLLGDDTVGAPLYLWIGKKKSGGGFLQRNGLARGKLYVWVADTGAEDPGDFNGQGATLAGTFARVKAKDKRRRNGRGYDARGYLDDTTLRDATRTLGAFRFSRPEDVHNNPFDGTQAVLASTGRSSSFPEDRWGTLYRIATDLSNLKRPTATLTILWDSDALPDPDAGIRSPDNVVWADDGFIYVQEDPSTSAFGESTGREASVWALDPEFGTAVRVAEMNRSAVPAGQRDDRAGDLGAWESSGVIDVTRLFKTAVGERLLLLDVQAHGIDLGNDDLDEGGQLLFLSLGAGD